MAEEVLGPLLDTVWARLALLLRHVSHLHTCACTRANTRIHTQMAKEVLGPLLDTACARLAFVLRRVFEIAADRAMAGGGCLDEHVCMHTCGGALGEVLLCLPQAGSFRACTHGRQQHTAAAHTPRTHLAFHARSARAIHTRYLPLLITPSLPPTCPHLLPLQAAARTRCAPTSPSTLRCAPHTPSSLPSSRTAHAAR